MTPAFTIITPALNAERWIADAVSSVVDQSRADWELIVIDNGSTDATAAAVEPFLADPRVRLIRAAENRPPAVLRNELARTARGQYLVMLDADDRLLPRFLEVAGQRFEARPQIAVVSPDALLIEGEEGRPMPGTLMVAPWWHKPKGLTDQTMLEALLDHVFIYAGAAVRRADFVALGGLDEAFFGCMDWDLWIRIVASGREICIVDEPLAVYRVHGGSLSRPSHDRSSERFAQNVADMIESNLGRLSLTARQRSVARRTLARVRRNMLMARARAQLVEGDSRGARRSAAQALKIRPGLRTTAVSALVILRPGWALRMHLSRLQQAARSGRALGFRSESRLHAIRRRARL